MSSLAGTASSMQNWRVVYHGFMTMLIKAPIRVRARVRVKVRVEVRVSVKVKIDVTF